MITKEMDLSKCFICGKKASTEEHIFPKWLQRKFNLWTQQIVLPNNVPIQYKKLKIPSCKKCNNEIFSKLENRVKNNKATESDIWKWTNKIHYALGYKDKLLHWDRTHKDYTISQIINPNDPIERARRFLLCVSGELKTYPDPFGSVFEFKFKKTQRYFFAHLIASSSICISLGDIGYIIFLIDGRSMKEESGLYEHYLKYARSPIIEDMLFFYANCLEMYTRHELIQNIIFTDTMIAKIGKTKSKVLEPANKDRFNFFCSKLGLEWLDADEYAL